MCVNTSNLMSVAATIDVNVFFFSTFCAFKLLNCGDHIANLVMRTAQALVNSGERN